jgi:hypothetical protein
MLGKHISKPAIDSKGKHDSEKPMGVIKEIRRSNTSNDQQERVREPFNSYTRPPAMVGPEPDIEPPCALT